MKHEAQARPAHELDPVQEQPRAMLTHERPAVQREDPLPVVAERLRDEAAVVRSFRTPQEARAFRKEMEGRFDTDTLARLGRGEATALAQVAPDRVDGLCLAKAWLDSGGEPERSQARMYLADRFSDAQIDAKREKHGHEEDGHSWSL